MGDSITIYPPDSLWMIGNTLHWSSVECDYLTGYRVYKGRNSNEYGFPYFVRNNYISFDDLIENLSYFFRVSSVDTLENESVKSKELSVIVQKDTLLKKEINVVISWYPNQENDLAGYKVYRGISSRDYDFVNNVGNVISWSDSIFCDSTYYYAVTAYDTANNESVFSNEVIANFTCQETLVGDFDGDGEVGFFDIMEFAPFFAVTMNNPKYNSKYDLDNDGEIWFFDLLILARNFGKKL